MKKFLAILAALTFVALPLTLTAQYNSTQYTAFSGVSLLTSVPATKTFTSAPLRLPTFSGVGTLNITETGITGSPSGCTIALSYVQNNALSSAVVAAQTVSFTPSTGVQQFNVSPSTAEGDQYVATYACSTTYPTAGAISVTFSPALVTIVHPFGGDPCENPNIVKSSAVISVASASTVQVIALSSGKSIYVCGVSDGSAGTTPSLVLLYGTGTNCGTGGTALTGAIPFTSGSQLNLGWGGNIASTLVSNALCVTTVGAGHYGMISYVLQ
jgi:hypothetical protein